MWAEAVIMLTNLDGRLAKVSLLFEEDDFSIDFAKGHFLLDKIAVVMILEAEEKVAHEGGLRWEC